VAKPWGDSDRFDFIITCRQLLWRVQIKSAWAGPPYRIKTSGVRNIAYTAGDIDFIVAYIIPVDLWYVVPIADLASRKGLSLSPYSVNSKTEKYCEAWSLFRPPDPAASGL
jgi:PD-(D/E)XK endonuclease